MSSRAFQIKSSNIFWCVDTGDGLGSRFCITLKTSSFAKFMVEIACLLYMRFHKVSHCPTSGIGIKKTFNISTYVLKSVINLLRRKIGGMLAIFLLFNNIFCND